MKYTLPKIFQNKYFLYAVTLLAIGNIMGYLANEKYDCLSFFLAVGLLSSYFSKNMAVVLLIAMGTTAVFANKSFTEGFKEGHVDVKAGAANVTNNASPGNTPSNVVTQPNLSPETSAASNANKGQAAAAVTDRTLQEQGAVAGQQASQETNNTSTTTSENNEGYTNPMRFCYQKQADNSYRKKKNIGAVGASSDGKVAESLCKGNNDQWGGGCYQLDANSNAWALVHQDVEQCMTQRSGTGGKDNYKWCPATGCPKQGFGNMKKKSGTESKEARVDGVDESVGDRIDYANTMKQSMDNLQDMLGTDGMKGLAAETKKLVSQQKELVDSLGQMAPVLNSAKSTLDSLNLPDMKGITNILGVLKGGK